MVVINSRSFDPRPILGQAESYPFVCLAIYFKMSFLKSETAHYHFSCIPVIFHLCYSSFSLSFCGLGVFLKIASEVLELKAINKLIK